METFLIKSGITMAVLLVLYHLLFEREKMHRFNRFYLLGALLFSLLLPFVSIPIYVERDSNLLPPIVEQTIEFKSQQMPKNVSSTHISPSIIQVTEANEELQVNYLPYIGWGLYLLAVLTLTIRFAVNISRFYKLKRENLTVSYEGANLVLLNIDVLPHTFLNNIYINRGEYENRSIEPELFTHELVHVKQYHTLDILFIEALKIIFWFNPLLYFYKKAIQLNHEFIADEKVIDITADTIYYQNLLLKRSTVGKTFSLASNLNFSITKKRFIMMTKTTNKAKSIILRTAIMPVIACLLYFISTETVIAKGKTHNAVPFTPISHDNITKPLPEDTIVQSPPAIKVKDSIDERRDEYFKDIQIVIDDKPKGISINKPYEKLTREEKQYYLSNIPEKEKALGVQISDYNSYIDGDGTFYLDNQKVAKTEILKHKIEYFACAGSKRSGSDKRYFFYTYPYFNKNIKTLNDHYPEKTYKITILNEALEYPIDDAPAEKKTYKRNGDTSSEDGYTAEVSYISFGYTDETKDRTHEIMAHFPGGNDKFNDYLFNNLRVSEKLKQNEIVATFVINTDGSLSDIFLDENMDPELEKEVRRVMLTSPKWIPAQKNGKPYQLGTRLYFKNKS